MLSELWLRFLLLRLVEVVTPDIGGVFFRDFVALGSPFPKINIATALAAKRPVGRVRGH